MVFGGNMKRKVKGLLDNLVEEISRWETVDTITVAETVDEELLSPYLSLSLDIFYRRTIPEPEKRQKNFEEAALFESSYFGSQDRFLLQEIPVRLEYKGIDRIEALIRRGKGKSFVSRESGSHLFYRLLNNDILFHRSPWIDKVRHQVGDLPEEFWISLKEAYWSSLEHQLGDLGAAVVAEDEFFCFRSLGSYLNTLCSLLFVLNKRFEPSGRWMQQELEKLDRLPENFRGRFASLIGEDPDFTSERKLEVAQLIARSLTPFV